MLIYLVGLLGFFILVGWLMYLVTKIDEGLTSKYQPPRIPPTWESGPYHCSRCKGSIYSSQLPPFRSPTEPPRRPDIPQPKDIT